MKEISDLKEKPLRIYSEFGNNIELKEALKNIAKELHLEVYYGSDWDFVATNFDIAILNRACLEPEVWDFYISSGMVDQSSTEQVILVDNKPIKQILPFYKINQVDSGSKKGNEHIIGIVRNSDKLSNKYSSA